MLIHAMSMLIHAMLMYVDTCNVNACWYMQCQCMLIHAMSMHVDTCNVNVCWYMQCQCMLIHAMLMYVAKNFKVLSTRDLATPLYGLLNPLLLFEHKQPRSKL